MITLLMINFIPIPDALKNWKINAVVDGEIVVLNKKGSPDFGALQNWRSEADGDLVYYLFDILWYDGSNIQDLPLTERKSILQQLIPDDPLLQYSKSFDISGNEFLASAKKLGLEGIMAKRKNSIYEPGSRTDNWRKIKANKRQEVVIGGYTLNKGSDKPFSALLVGVFEEDKFVYTGKIGTGFTRKIQNEMLQQFKPLIIKKPPFDSEPDIHKPSRFRPDPPKASATWLKPQLICEVSFAEMTRDGVMRHPSFEGMRDDKKATEVILEKEQAISDFTVSEKDHSGKKYLSDKKQAERKTLLNPKEETQVKKINKQTLTFTNLNKLYWPAERLHKRDMINYYYQAAPFILPYLADRPLSL